MTKEKIDIIEKIVLDGWIFDGVCPHCGNNVSFKIKDCGLNLVSGNLFYFCECGNTILVEVNHKFKKG